MLCPTVCLRRRKRAIAMRLIFNGLTYRITQVDNVLNLRHELKLKCKAVDL